MKFMLNIFAKHYSVTFNDKDPRWMTKQIKTILNEKEVLEISDK